MMRENQLCGIYVPVVTPFDAAGKVDADSLRNNTEHLINCGVHGLVLSGTTGEGQALTSEELMLAVRTVKQAAGHRSIPVVAGTGTGDTASTLQRTELAGAAGADAALIVTPYYSRPSQAGIVEHFRHAAGTGIPVIAYENPARSGVRMTAETITAVLAMDGVIGMKDSTGGIGLISEAARSGVTKPVLAGDDASFFAMLCCGAGGGILASANVETAAFLDVYNRFVSGDFTGARERFGTLLPLIRLLFREPNPAPLKWLLHRQGLIASDTLRLPMIPISQDLRLALEQHFDLE